MNIKKTENVSIAYSSLALVDLAQRRRFAFEGLGPRLGPALQDRGVKEWAVDSALIADIEHRMAELNDQIAADVRLGKQFRIGHSDVMPATGWRPGT